MINLGVLGSTNGTDLQPILDAIGAGRLDAKVAVVISNREDAYILERAKKHNTPNVFINHKGRIREDFDSEMTIIVWNMSIGGRYSLLHFGFFFRDRVGVVGPIRGYSVCLAWVLKS